MYPLPSSSGSSIMRPRRLAQEAVHVRTHMALCCCECQKYVNPFRVSNGFQPMQLPLSCLQVALQARLLYSIEALVVHQALV